MPNFVFAANVQTKTVERKPIFSELDKARLCCPNSQKKKALNAILRKWLPVSRERKAVINSLLA